jgi:hypothetical protein
LQAAFDKLSEKSGEANTVYLPPGTYRISKTIAVKQRDGVSIIGCGRGTRIVWDGPGGKGDDARMFWSNGAPRSRYVGISWDGRGKAHVGFDHDSKGYFETEIDHQHEAFLNFSGSGIRIGHDQNTPGAQATAETTYANCLFMNCESGLTLMQFNDYNHTLAGCEFRDCGIGVNSTGGANFYVRDSHFARSRILDVRVRGEHAMSVRRCTSTDSRMFIEEATIAPLTVQDCQVADWTNPEGALRLGSGPVLLFDCVFTRPTNRLAPIVPGNHIEDPARCELTVQADRIIGRSEGCGGLLYAPMPPGMKVLSTLVIDGQTYAPGTSGNTLIIPLMPGDHAFEVRALEQPPVFRNWQAWDK